MKCANFTPVWNFRVMCLALFFFLQESDHFSKLIRFGCIFKSKFHKYQFTCIKKGLNIHLIRNFWICFLNIRFTAFCWFIGINDCAQNGSYCKSLMCRITFQRKVDLIQLMADNKQSQYITVCALHTYTRWIIWPKNDNVC